MDWYTSKQDLDLTLDLAEELLDQHGDAHLSAVGQSMAWPVYIAGYMRTLCGEPANISLIPFSGAFLSRTFNDQMRMPNEKFNVSSQKGWPGEDATRAYFNHLAAIDEMPADIAARPQKTVFVDFGVTGRGLASFIALYLGHARQDGTLSRVLEQAVFQIYHLYDASKKPVWQLNLPEGAPIAVPVKHRRLTNKEGSTVCLLSGNNELHSYSGRIVPYLNLCGEGDHVPQLADNAQNIQRIKTKVHQEAAARLA